MKLLRTAIRVGLFGLAFLAGCGFPWWGLGGGGPAYGVSYPMYGMEPTPGPPHDSTVVLEDFSYTPASPIHVGDSLRFTATANHTTDTGYVVAIVDEGQYDYHAAEMRDDGQAPDDVAGDGVWRGELAWLPEFGTCSKALVTVYLHWYDYTEGLSLLAPKLTVLPEEAGQ